LQARRTTLVGSGGVLVSLINVTPYRRLPPF